MEQVRVKMSNGRDSVWPQVDSKEGGYLPGNYHSVLCQSAP